PSLSSRAARLTIRSLFDSLGSIGPLEDPVHEDAGRDHVVRIDLARLDQLLDLDERHVPRGRGHRVEVSRGHSVDEIPHRVALPGLHEREVAPDRHLEHVLLPVEDARLLAVGDHGAHARGRVETADPRAARPHALRERALGNQLHLQLAAQVLLLERRVLADVARDHLSYLPRLEEEAEAPVVHARVVRDAREVLHARVAERHDQVLGESGQAEPAEDDGRTVLDVRLLDRLARVLNDLVHAPTFARRLDFTQPPMYSMIAVVGVPGPKRSPTPLDFSAAMSSFEMIPPPVRSTSAIPFSFISSSTRGKSVMCAPERMERATASTSSCTAAWTIISGVWWSPV